MMLNRTDASALLPDDVIRDIISGVRKQSVAMQLMRRLPNMTSGTARQPVLSMLPVADFVNGDAGMKVTTSMAWDNKYLFAGEIAAIVPVPQAVIDDADYDLWGEVRPLLVESFGRIFDRQVFMGGNPKAPAVWPGGLIPTAIAAGNAVIAGEGVDIAGDISATMGVLENDGYEVTAIAAQRKVKAKLRDLRDTTQNPIYQSIAGGQPGTVYNVPTHFVGPGVWSPADALAVLGEWHMAVYSIRQDITFEIFDTGVISDDDGRVVYNLLQQDMVAMRAVMRLAWQIANPVDIDRPYGAGFPFAVLQPAPTP